MAYILQLLNMQRFWNRDWCFFSFAGPPVNVTCNIFINSFGSIAETTMVRYFTSNNV